MAASAGGVAASAGGRSGGHKSRKIPKFLQSLRCALSLAQPAYLPNLPLPTSNVIELSQAFLASAVKNIICERTKHTAHTHNRAGERTMHWFGRVVASPFPSSPSGQQRYLGFMPTKGLCCSCQCHRRLNKLVVPVSRFRSRFHTAVFVSVAFPPKSFSTSA